MLHLQPVLVVGTPAGTLSLPIPNTPALAVSSLCFQGVSLMQSGCAMFSDALVAVIQL